MYKMFRDETDAKCSSHMSFQPVTTFQCTDKVVTVTDVPKPPRKKGRPQIVSLEQKKEAITALKIATKPLPREFKQVVGVSVYLNQDDLIPQNQALLLTANTVGCSTQTIQRWTDDFIADDKYTFSESQQGQHIKTQSQLKRVKSSS